MCIKAEEGHLEGPQRAPGEPQGALYRIVTNKNDTRNNLFFLYLGKEC